MLNLLCVCCLFCFISEIESHYVVQAVLKLIVSTNNVLGLELYATLSGVLTDFEIPSAHEFLIALRKGVQTHVPYVLPLDELREKQTQ